MTAAPTLTTLSHAGTATTPLIQGTAFTSNITITTGTDAMADTETLITTFVLTDPVGNVVKNATFTAAAGPIGTNGVITQSAASAGYTSGQVITVTATGGTVAAAGYVVGTLSFTPTMGGTYALTSAITGTAVDGTKTEMDGTTSPARGALYVQGIAVTQGTTRGNPGAAKTGNQAKVTITYPEAEGTTYKMVSSGVGAIIGATPTDAVNTNISGVSTDFSQGLTTVTTTNNTAHNNALTLSSTVAGVQTITVTTVDTTTGLSTALYSIKVTWSAIATLLPTASIVRHAPVATVGNAQGDLASTATNYTALVDAVPLSAIKTTGTNVATIQVLLVNNDGTAATGGHTVTASVSGSGFVLTDTTSTVATGNARSSSVTLTAGSQNLAWVHVSADGTAGTGTITVSVTDAVTLATTVIGTETFTFYGAVSALAVDTTNFNIGRAGYTTGGASGTRASVTEVDITTSISPLTATTTTPAFVVKAADSNGNAVTTTSVPTVVSSDANVVTGGTCVLDLGSTTYGSSTNGVGYYNCNFTTAPNAVSGAKATLTIRVADPASTTGGYITTTYPVTVGGSVANSTLTFDKATYSPGEAMTITRTATDASGNPVYDGASAGAVTFSKAIGGSVGSDYFIGGKITSDGAYGKTIYAPAVDGDFTASLTGKTAAVTAVITAKATVENGVAAAASQAAADAAAEATDAANAATDAANAAAEAADAATAAAQDAADAVAALSTQVSSAIDALKKQIVALTNLVIKIQKKVKA
jgi:hypothetical protein